MAFEEEIKMYDIAYYGGGKNITGYKYRAIIGLRRQDGTLIGAAYFHRSSKTLPDSDAPGTSGQINCHYMAEDYQQVLDVLRNEKPVYLCYVAEGWNIGSIATSMEPVGEGEEPLAYIET